MENTQDNYQTSYAPKSVFYTKNADGTTTRTEQWDFRDIANINIILCILAGVVFLAATSIVAPILIIALIFVFNGQGKVLNILGIIASCYFLIDATHGWLGVLTLNLLFSVATINYLFAINGACILINVIFLLFGGEIYKYLMTLTNEIKQKNTLLLIIGVLFVTGFLITFGVTSNKTDLVYKTKVSSTEQSLTPVQREDQEKQQEEQHNKDIKERWGN